MSRGPGRVQRAVIAAFDADPGNAFTVEDLCAFVYPGLNRVEKKHRVAIIRAMKSIAGGDADYRLTAAKRVGGALIISRRYDVLSRSMAYMKADALWAYQTPRAGRYTDPTDEAEFKRLLSPGNRYYDRWVKPGALMWRKVQIELAKRDGDLERATALQDAENARLNAWVDEGRGLMALLNLYRGR